MKFAAKLTNAKCWPESIGSTPMHIAVGSCDLEIRKCKSFNATAINEDRNVSGLALTLIHKVSGTNDALMLLPGDCHFDGIPNLPIAPIRALVAYHHGSHVHWTGATSTTISSGTVSRKMYYSYGKNRYGHPDRSNYSPDWDPHAGTTADLRARGSQHGDVNW